MLLNLLFSLLLFTGQAKAEITNQLILQEDENLKVTLIYSSKVDICDVNWLKVKIENKTNCDLKITSAHYFLNGYYGFEESEDFINMGKYGSGNLLDFIQEKIKINGKIKPESSIKVGTSAARYLIGYLAGYGDEIYNGRKLTDDDICVLFQFKIDYELQEERLTLECKNEPFSFTWISPECVPEAKIRSCLQKAMLHPNVNPMVIGKFINDIPSEDLIQGILARENTKYTYESKMFLRELARRNAIPDERITDVFIRKFDQNAWVSYEELLFYWDNVLLDKILNSKMPLPHMQMVLEEYSNEWSVDSENQKKVYDYFIKTLNFKKVDTLALKDRLKWATNIKIIAMSRSSEFIEYLKPFLEDESEFFVEDWLDGHHYHPGIYNPNRPTKKIKVRVCDAALVAILRASNQIEFKLRDKSGTKGFDLTMNNDILSLETTNQMMGKGQPYSLDIQGIFTKNYLKRDINLSLYETIIKLTPEIKDKINRR